MSPTMFRHLLQTLSIALVFFFFLLVAPSATLAQTSPEPAPATDPSPTPKDGKNNLHFSVGMSAAPYFLYDTGKVKAWHLGMAAMPELRFGWAFTKDRHWRVFGSLRWSALSTATLLSETPTGIAPIRANDAEFIGVAGVSVIVSPEGSSRSTVSSSITGLSLALGGGNAKTNEGTVIGGFVVLLSVDVDLVSFNF